jgi:DNA-binding MarR family transcriptional regulator
MSVKRDALAFKVPGKVLGTRVFGQEVASQLRKRAGDRQQDLFVDFAGVQVASSPFLDELARTLRAWNTDHPEHFVVLMNLNEDVQDTLELVLERLDMVLAEMTEGTLRLIGGKAHLQETLDAAQKFKVFTAAELAAQLKLKLPNLHQRLVALEAAGAVVRVHPPGAPQRPVVFQTPESAELAARS